MQVEGLATPMLGKTMRLLEQGLSATNLRSRVIANNIANVNVKNFKRGEVIFEEELKRSYAAEQAQQIPKLSLQTTHPQHISRRGFQAPPVTSVQPSLHYDTASTMRNDGNNIDMEHEVAQMVRNQFQYNLYAERIGSKFRSYQSFLRMP